MNRHKKIYAVRKWQGYLIIFALALCAFLCSQLEWVKKIGISALIIAVCLGAFVGNFSQTYTHLLKRSGVLNLSTKQILRLGIILYGFKITLIDIKHLGFSGVFMAFLVVFSTFFIGLFLGKFLKMDTKESILISSGSSICGAAAVMASQSVVQGDSSKVAIAICTVVVFGTFGMFLYPLIYHFGFLNLSEAKMGYFIGASLHEVAHVVASASGVSELAKNNAVILKMMRVLMLVPFLLMLTFLCLKLFNHTDKKKLKLKQNFPYFAFYFLVAVVLSSLPIFNTPFALEFIKPNIELLDTYLLSVAMVALGINIHKNTLKNAGLKPFLMSILLFIWLFVFCFIGVKYIMN